MKNYESPVIYDNEELAEGVYATGSGGGEDGTCWSVFIDPDPKMHQDYAGVENGNSKSVIQIKALHSTSVGHDSIGLTFEGDIQTFELGDTVSDVKAENPNDYTVSWTKGSTHFFCTRSLYGDAFHSGDTVTFKIIVYSSLGDVKNPPKVVSVYNPVCNKKANDQYGENS